ncbi:hypothetical protein [Aquibium sp. ELW1220]|uniref:hypothetical protein n=1 Tax=Aquibium sp. ELW1220 TaxID=2976766 RepID=UPI0025AF2692|nr:hypothetical protein [Aquibium sp. ELW1220]MDN2584243.1 ANP1/MMN9/VAN1 family protein [Aquibium sp. ELW1220]
MNHDRDRLKTPSARKSAPVTLDRVPLNSVGGTALFVHSDVHRAGLKFPEIPYECLIETEAFGQLARDLGVTPVGLPKVQVRHHAS